MSQQKFDDKLVALLKSNWSVLLVGVLVRQLIAICGVITFLTDAVGHYVGDILFRLIPPNNVTINATEFQKRLDKCMGGWSTGVELLTLIVVMFIFLGKYIILKCVIDDKPEADITSL